MNEFFKFLIPQLLEYFKNDKEAVKVFVPKILMEQYNNLLLPHTEDK